MEAKDIFILEEISSYCDKIADTISRHPDGFTDFENDSEYQDVCAFRVMQIGELVNSLSDNFKSLHHEMPWHQIVAFRNIVSHDYGKVDHAIMWTTITEDIPALKAFCSEQLS
ncbi:DUF86 domain-containing protein [Candidatus Saccharibacteria bacterium]|nr:DUF86 domain-containing protein [Candidatus Saccharibacteria bacterium]